MHIFVHGFVDTVKSKVTELYFVTFVIEILNHTAYYYGRVNKDSTFYILFY